MGESQESGSPLRPGMIVSLMGSADGYCSVSTVNTVSTCRNSSPQLLRVLNADGGWISLVAENDAVRQEECVPPEAKLRVSLSSRNGTIAFMTQNGKYCSDTNSGLRCNADTVNVSESFRWRCVRHCGIQAAGAIPALPVCQAAAATPRCKEKANHGKWAGFRNFQHPRRYAQKPASELEKARAIGETSNSFTSTARRSQWDKTWRLVFAADRDVMFITHLKEREAQGRAAFDSKSLCSKYYEQLKTTYGSCGVHNGGSGDMFAAFGCGCFGKHPRFCGGHVDNPTGYRVELRNSTLDNSQQNFSVYNITGTHVSKANDTTACLMHFGVRLATCESCCCPGGLVRYETTSRVMSSGCDVWYLKVLTAAANFFGVDRLQALRFANRECGAVSCS